MASGIDAAEPVRRAGSRCGPADDRGAADRSARWLEAHRSAASRATRALVPASRSLTSRAVATERPCVVREVARRAPADPGPRRRRRARPAVARAIPEHAPADQVVEPATSRSGSRRPRSRPRPGRARRRAATLPAPTNASSSTMTGRAPGGSRTPPMVTPAERWTPRADLRARADEDVRIDHRVRADPGADVDVRRRHDRRRPSRGATPRRTAVPPGTIRHGPPARSSPGRHRGRSRNVERPGVPGRPRRRGRRSSARIAALTSGPDAPAVGRGPGRARPRRMRPASRSSRIVAGRPRSAGGRRCRASRSAVMPPPPAATARPADPPAARLDETESRGASTPSRPARRRAAAAGARTASMSSRPIGTQGGLRRHGVGTAAEVGRKSGSHRSWIRRASSQSPARAAAHSATISPGISFDATETTPSPPMREDGRVHASSPARHRDVARPVAADRRRSGRGCRSPP